MNYKENFVDMFVREFPQYAEVKSWVLKTGIETDKQINALWRFYSAGVINGTQCITQVMIDRSSNPTD